MGILVRVESPDAGKILGDHILNNVSLSRCFAGELWISTIIILLPVMPRGENDELQMDGESAKLESTPIGVQSTHHTYFHLQLPLLWWLQKSRGLKKN